MRHPLVPREGRRFAGCPPQEHVPESDASHPARGEVREPRFDQARIVGTAGHRPAIADPQLRIGERIQVLPFDDPGVEVNVGCRHPSAHAVEPVFADAVLPVRQQLCGAARHQMAPDLTDEGRHEVITAHPAVAILVRRDARHPRGDHERRVRDDSVELLAGHRFEQTPVSHLDAVQVVDERIQPREFQRPP